MSLIWKFYWVFAQRVPAASLISLLSSERQLATPFSQREKGAVLCASANGPSSSPFGACEQLIVQLCWVCSTTILSPLQNLKTPTSVHSGDRKSSLVEKIGKTFLIASQGITKYKRHVTALSSETNPTNAMTRGNFLFMDAFC